MTVERLTCALDLGARHVVTKPFEMDEMAALIRRRTKRGFLVQGEDRVGAVADLLERFGAAKINVTTIDAVCVGDGRYIDAVSVGNGRYGAILWVAPKDVKKAGTLLGASAASAGTVEA